MSPAPRRRPSRRPLLVAAIVFVVAAVAAWIALAVAFPPERLRAVVRRQLEARLDREVRFGDARIGLWPPVRLTVRDPALAEPEGFAQGTLFRARAIHLDLDVGALLRRRLVVRRLLIDGPAVHVLVAADGRTNLDGLVKESPPGRAPSEPMDFSVEDLGIAGGQVLFDDVAARRRIAFALSSRLSLEHRGGTRWNTSGETEISGLAHGPLSAARLADLDRSLAELRGQIEHAGAFDTGRQRLALERLGLRLGEARLEFNGIVDDPGPRARVDLRAKGERLDLGDLLAFASRADVRGLDGIRGDGRLDFDLAVKGALGLAGAGARGALALPAVSGTLALEDGVVQFRDAPARVEGLAFTARLAPDSLGIPNLRARVSGQPVRAALTAERFADPRVAFAIQGDLDLGAVAPLVAPEDVDLTGHAALDLRGQGRARDPGALAVTGRAVLVGVRAAHPELAKPIDNLNGTIDFSRTRAQVSGLAAKIGASSFALNATVERPLALLADATKPDAPAPAGIAFDFRSALLDVADVMPKTSGGPILLPHARGEGRATIARFRNGKVDLANVNAEIVLEPRVIGARHFGAQVYGGNVAGSARFDVTDAAHPQVELTSRLDDGRVEQFLGAWLPRAGWLKGALDMTLNLSGDLSDPRRSVTVEGLANLVGGSFADLEVLDHVSRLTKLEAYEGVSFEDLTTHFRVERGRVFTGPATMRGPMGEWKLSGSVGLDGSLDYVASGTVPPGIADRIGARQALAAGALADDQGRVILDLRITGPAKSPQVAWDPRAMQERVQGRVSSALAEQQQKVEQQVRDSVRARVEAVEDSARAAARRYRDAVRDSLARRGRDALEGFFGGRDTSRAN